MARGCNASGLREEPIPNYSEWWGFNAEYNSLFSGDSEISNIFLPVHDAVAFLCKKHIDRNVKHCSLTAYILGRAAARRVVVVDARRTGYTKYRLWAAYCTSKRSFRTSRRICEKNTSRIAVEAAFSYLLQVLCS